MKKSIYLFVLFMLFVPKITHASPTLNELAPAFTGVNSAGETVQLSDFLGKPVILEWTNHQCPYVKKHYNGGNMQKTQKALTEDGAVWISIISSAPGLQGHVSAEEAQKLTESRGVYADMVILDESGEIGRKYAAVTSPQMFLIDEEGTLLYKGAIDDKPSTQVSSLDGATNYVLAAWQAFKAGDAIEPASTKPYGCSIKYAD